MVVVVMILVILGWALAVCAFAFSTTAMVGRVFVGIFVGIVIIVVFLLFIEVSLKFMCGVYVILFNLVIVKGVLFMYLSSLSSVTMYWRYLVGVCVMFNVIVLIIVIICVVEFLRWLLV